jgi:Straboviridae/Kyanoviridae head completion nuclease
MKGMFKPYHPEKYAGNPLNIVYRSQWELKMMMTFDHDPNIIGWASEEKAIPYRSPLDNRIHRYYPDFILKERLTNGKTCIKIIEVKPFDQTLPPKQPSTKGGSKPRRTKRFIKEVEAYAVNMSKWASARKYCEQIGAQFVILTENEIFGRTHK